MSVLLDPLCTMTRLIQLNFINNAKICIHNHIVMIQEPSPYTSITRSIYGDSRNDIGDLYYAIIRLIKWFIIENDDNKIYNDIHNQEILDEKNIDDLIESDENNNDENTKSGSIKSTDSGKFIDKYIKKKEKNMLNDNEFTVLQLISNNKKFKKLVKYLISGLEKMQETYKNGGIVVLTLQYYKNIIVSALENTFIDNMLPQTFDNIEECQSKNFLDYNKIKNFWDIRDIEYICGLYEECFVIQKNEFLTKEQKNTYITGKIKNVNSILQMYEDKFILLISNNKRG